MDCLPEHYLILEISAELQQRQQQTLAKEVPHLMERIGWLKALPEKFHGVIVANEVIDAMPVKIFKKRGEKFHEQMVEPTGDGWQWQTNSEDNPQLQSFGGSLEKSLTHSLENGYESEVNFMQQGLLASLSDCLQQGLILLVDYGFPEAEYYHPQRPGTLMCHYRHFSHSNPLVLLGLQDVTAHVNFTALAEQALDCKLQVHGYTDQASFLTNCGLLQRMEQLAGIDDAKIIRYSQQVKFLILPSEMGELFKVIAMGRSIEELNLIGFTMSDKRSRL
jgi:SAM-dependent MidA family methyltransferase